MFTVCPKCALSLVVTAADLRAAQGYVRCGRCANVFNAVGALADEQPPTTDAMAEYVEPETTEAPLEAEPDKALEFDSTKTDVSQVFIGPPIADDEPTGTFEAIVLESKEPDPTGPDEEPVTAPAAVPTEDDALANELRSLAERIQAESDEVPAAAPPVKAEAPPQNIFPLEPGLRRSDGTTRDAGLLEDAQQIGGTDRGPLHHAWAWRGGIAALAVVFVAQVVNHYRDSLAVRPFLNAPLTAFYRAIGMPLVPRWDLSAYDVRQLGASGSVAGADRLVVRASIQNTAPHPQPLPLLRVSVQDRFGNRIATRDVAPAAYLPRGAHTNTLMAAAQRLDVEIAFVDPGTDAVGFEIDACLPAASGGVRCANVR